MNDIQIGPTLMMGIAVLISIVNLLIAIGRTRVKQAEEDTQALQMAVKLAEKTPDLEDQLRATIADLHKSGAEAQDFRRQIDELNQLVALQADEIRRLKQENDHLAGQLKELRMALQALRPAEAG